MTANEPQSVSVAFSIIYVHQFIKMHLFFSELHERDEEHVFYENLGVAYRYEVSKEWQKGQRQGNLTDEYQR